MVIVILVDALSKFTESCEIKFKLVFNYSAFKSGTNQFGFVRTIVFAKNGDLVK